MIPDPNYIRWQFQPRLQCRAMKGQWIIFSASLTAVYWMSLSYWYVVKTVLEKKTKKKNQITQRKSESSVCSRKNRWYILDWIFSWKVCRLVVIAGKLRFIWNVKKYLLFCVSVHSESAVFHVWNTVEAQLKMVILINDCCADCCFLVHRYSVWVFIAERIIMMLPNCGPKWASSFWQINNLHHCLYEPHILTC